MTKLGSARWGMGVHVSDYRKAIRTRWMTIAPANWISFTVICYTRSYGIHTEFSNFQIRFLIPYTRFLPDCVLLSRIRVSFTNIIFMGQPLCLTVSVKRISPVVFRFDVLANSSCRTIIHTNKALVAHSAIFEHAICPFRYFLCFSGWSATYEIIKKAKRNKQKHTKKGQIIFRKHLSY